MTHSTLIQYCMENGTGTFGPQRPFGNERYILSTGRVGLSVNFKTSPRMSVATNRSRLSVHKSSSRYVVAVVGVSSSISMTFSAEEAIVCSTVGSFE
jgi:hypothetical protein